MAFGQNVNELMVVTQGASGGSKLVMYHIPSQQGKAPEVKWTVSVSADAGMAAS